MEPVEQERGGEWVEEMFYFGLGEYAIYRRRGVELQLRVEKAIELNENKGAPEVSCVAGVDGVAEFLTEHRDCFFSMLNDHSAKSGGLKPFSCMYLIGWVDVPPEEYERDKRDAMGVA